MTSTKGTRTPPGAAPRRSAYPTLDTMVRLGIPMTREKYLSLTYPDSQPENELELPPQFRRDAH